MLPDWLTPEQAAAQDEDERLSLVNQLALSFLSGSRRLPGDLFRAGSYATSLPFRAADYIGDTVHSLEQVTERIGSSSDPASAVRAIQEPYLRRDAGFSQLVGESSADRAEAVAAPHEEAASFLAPPPPETLAEEVAQGVGGSVPQTASTLAAMLLNPAAGSALALGLAGDQAEREALSRGVGDEEAFIKGLGVAAGSVALDRVGARALADVLGPAGRSAVTRALIAEPSTEAAQELVAISGELATGAEYSSGDILRRLGVAGVAGAAISTPIAGVAALRGGGPQQPASRFPAELSSRRGLPEDVFREVEAKDNKVAAGVMAASYRAGRLRDAMQSHQSASGATALELDGQVKDALANVGGDAFKALSPELQAEVEASRADIDSLTDALIESDLLTDEQVATLEANRGQYVARTYKATRPEDFLRLPVIGRIPVRVNQAQRQLEAVAPHIFDRSGKAQPTEDWLLARDYVRRTTDDPLSDADIDAKLKAIFEGHSLSNTGTSHLDIDQSPLMRRSRELDDAPEIRKILGEEDAPTSVFNTLARTVTSLSQSQMWDSILQGSMGRLVFEGLPASDTAALGSLVNLESAASGSGKGSSAAGNLLRVSDPSRAFGNRQQATGEQVANRPQAGKPSKIGESGELWADRNLLEHLDAAINQSHGPILDSLRMINGRVKAGLVLFSPQAQVRNAIYSNPLALLAGGNFGLTGSPLKALRRAKAGSGFVPKTEADRQAAIDRVGRGVYGASVDVNDARNLLSGGRSQDYDTPWKKGIALSVAEKSYELGDNFWKDLAYEAEKKKLELAYPDAGPDRIQAEAAEIVRSTMQNYNRLPPIIERIRAFPAVGPFVAFPAASMINLKNQIRQGLRETGMIAPEGGSLMATEGVNGRTKALGLYRLGSTGVAVMGSSAVKIAAGAAIAAVGKEVLSGEDTKDALAVSPDYYRPSEVMFIRGDEAGELWAIDLGHIDYFESAKAPFLAALRAGDIQDESWQEAAVKAALEPYVSAEIFTGSVLEILSNKDFRTGREIFKESSEPMARFEDKMAHLLTRNMPTLAKNVLRAKRGAEGDPRQSVTAELAALGGIRVSRVDFRTSVRQNGSWANRQVALNSRFARATLLEPGPVTREKAIEIAKEEEAATERVYRRLVRIRDAAENQGVPPEVIELELRSGGFGAARSKEMAAGVFDPGRAAEQWKMKMLDGVNEERQKRFQTSWDSWSRANPLASETLRDEKFEEFRWQWAPIQW